MLTVLCCVMAIKCHEIILHIFVVVIQFEMEVMHELFHWHQMFVSMFENDRWFSVDAAAAAAAAKTSQLHDTKKWPEN